MVENDMGKLERVLKAFANKRRLAIVRFLRKREEAVVGDIAEHIKLSFKSTSRHLSVLVAAEVLVSEQRGVHVHYRINRTLPRVARSIISVL